MCSHVPNKGELVSRKVFKATLGAEEDKLIPTFTAKFSRLRILGLAFCAFHLFSPTKSGFSFLWRHTGTEKMWRNSTLRQNQELDEIEKKAAGSGNAILPVLAEPYPL